MLKSAGASKDISKLDLFLFLQSTLLDEVVYRGIEIVSTFLCRVPRKGIHDQEIEMYKILGLISVSSIQGLTILKIYEILVILVKNDFVGRIPPRIHNS
mgnify:FL=1